MARIFISYVSEDFEQVRRLSETLKSLDQEIWLDKFSLKPGQRWKDVIAHEIKGGDYFIACFSQNSLKKRTSYMNEELTVAIETMRQRHHDDVWFIPVRLTDISIPNIPIGAGQYLDGIQFADLWRDWDSGIDQILDVMEPNLESYVHNSYHYKYDFNSADHLGICRVELVSDLHTLKGGIARAGSSWDYEPKEITVVSQLVVPSGEIQSMIQHDKIVGPYFEARTYWWDYLYDPPLTRGQHIIRRSTFTIEDAYSDNECTDSFNAIKQIKHFQWSATFPPDRPLKNWSVSRSNAGTHMDFATEIARGGPGRSISWKCSELVKGAHYTLRWQW